MSSRSVAGLAFSTLLVLLLSSLYLGTLMLRNEEDVAHAQNRRLRSYELADELRQSSDDLTRMARTYVVTGETRYGEYFDRIRAIRDGEAPRPLDYGSIYWDHVTATGEEPRADREPVALETLMRQEQFTEDEFALLRQAKIRSDTLVALEKRAMRAVEGLYADTGGAYVVPGRPDPGLARELMFGEAYHEAKAEIMKPLEELFARVGARTDSEVARLRRRGRSLRLLGVLLLAGSVLLLAGTYALLRRGALRTRGDLGRETLVARRQPLGVQARGITSVRSWPVAATAVVVVAGVLGFTWWTQALIERQTREDVSNALKTVLNTTSKAVVHWIRDREQETRVWTGHPEIAQACLDLLAVEPERRLLRAAPAQVELRDQVAGLLLERGYHGYLLLTPEGQVVASDTEEEIGSATEEVPAAFLQKMLVGPRRTAIHLPQRRSLSAASQGRDGPTILFASAVVGGEGDVLGVFAFRVDPEQDFTEILQRGRMGSSGESYAFNRSGQLISESRFDDHLRQMGLIPEGERGILGVEIRDPGGNLLRGHRPQLPRQQQPLTLMAREATAGRGGVNLDGYNDYRGVPVIGAWVWHETEGFGVTTEIDVDEAYRSLRTARRLFRTATAVTVVLILALTLMFRIDSSRRAAVQEQLSLQAAALTAAANGIAITDANGVIQWVNPAFSALTGYSFEEAVGGNPRVLKSGKHDRAFYDDMWDTIRSGRVWAGEVVNKRKDGTLYTEEMTITPVRDDDDSIVSYVAIKRDITERKEMETQLEQARLEAEAANRAKSEFLSSMSHELRTPLNGVLGYVQILQRDRDATPAQRERLEAIEGCGTHLLGLINDVLDLSKIEAGRLDVELGPTDLTRLIQGVAHIIKPRADVSGLGFNVDVAGTLPRHVRTDGPKLRQILVNLLGNAVKFTRRGSVSLSVAESPQGQLLMEVADTGAGIASDKLAAIFEPFKQAEAGKESGGTGLGLAISRRLAEALGGELGVESQLGEGSRFTLSLPLEEVEAAALADAEEGSGSKDGEYRLAPGQTITVLVADDSQTNRNILVGLLSQSGFATVQAADGVEALAILREQRMPLVLMDVRMPVMDGMEAMLAILADAELRETKVIAVTASVFHDDQAKVMEAGFHDFLAKPFRAGDLFRKIEALLDVEYEHVEAEPAAATPAALEVLSATRAADVSRRLRTAVEEGDVGGLEAIGEELRGSPDGATWGERIARLARDFDFDGLGELAAELEGSQSADQEGNEKP